MKRYDLRKRKNCDENYTDDSEDEELMDFAEKKNKKARIVSFDSEKIVDNDLVDYMSDKLYSFLKNQTITKKTIKEGIKNTVAVMNNDNILDLFEDEDDEDYDEDEVLWSSSLNKKQRNQYEILLKRLREESKNKEPTIEKILSSNVSDNDKRQALELFSIFSNTEPATYEYLSLRNEIDILINSNELVKTQHNKKDLKQQIFDLETSDDIKSKIYERYKQMSAITEEGQIKTEIRDWIKWAVGLPYNKVKPLKCYEDETFDISKFCSDVRKKLDENIYGLNFVKDRIMENIISQITNPKSHRGMITLYGPPGVGKSSIAKAIASAVGLPFERISLGGMIDPSIFKGVDRSWLGSSPNIILRMLSRMKCSNGIILFDELDKLDITEYGNQIQYALLNITDHTQNSETGDNYLSEFTHDLSRVWFIFTLNDAKHIDPVLKDRLDIIEIRDYTLQEKIYITQNYILKRTLEDVGLGINDVKLSEDATRIILGNISDSGLRGIERSISSLIKRINVLLHTKNVVSYSCDDIVLPLVVTPKILNSILLNSSCQAQQSSTCEWKMMYN